MSGVSRVGRSHSAGALVVRAGLLPFRNDNLKDQNDGIHERYLAQHWEGRYKSS